VLEHNTQLIEEDAGLVVADSWKEMAHAASA
jgi:hypothetical protein